MMKIMISERASAAYVSEMEYAASMYFSAAHLPGGTSSSLVADPVPLGIDSLSGRTTEQATQQQRTRS